MITPKEEVSSHLLRKMSQCPLRSKNKLFKKIFTISSRFSEESLLILRIGELENPKSEGLRDGHREDRQRGGVLSKR